jgi:hypothetical protein
VNRPRRFAVLAAIAAGSALVSAAAGCGSGTNPSSPQLHDIEAATRALNRAIGIQTAFVTTGNIDTGATPQIIANALANRVRAEAAGCVTATVSDVNVHADFGTGCALATASMHAGGTVDATVSADTATGGMTVSLTFAVTVDGQPLAGNLDVSTPNGNAFSYASSGLTLDGTTTTAPLLTAGIAAGGATLDAAHATANNTPLVLAALHERFAACYPDDGSATLATFAVTFASDTPQTGTVTLASGATTTLPARTGCLR